MKTIEHPASQKKAENQLIRMGLLAMLGSAWRWILTNLLSVHIRLLLCAVLISYALYWFGLSWYFYLIPLVIHACLWCYAYFRVKIAVQLQNIAWDRYVERYGNDKGEIPADVRMRHKQMIKEGKQIPL